MRHAAKRMVEVGFLCLLAGCGGLAETIEFAGNALDARDRNARVAALSNTGFAGMPDSGSVAYNGHASLVFGPPDAEVALLADARMTADFSGGQVDGRIDNFFGGTGISDVQSYTGALTFDGLIGVRRPNSFDADIAGRISGGGTTILLDGAFLGDFRGTGGRAVVAMTTNALEATVNAVDTPVRVRLIAER